MGFSLILGLLLSALLSAPPPTKPNDKVQIRVSGLPLTSYLSGAKAIPAVMVEKSGKTERYVLGSLRLELRDKTLYWGQDWPLAFLSGGTRVDKGWVFVASDGAFFAADTFLSPLRRLGQIDSRFRLSNSRGRAVAIDENGGLWTTLGGKGPAKVKSLADHNVLEATFSDAKMGFALVAPGRTLYTDNGGKSWVELDLGDNATFAVGLDRGRLMLDTLDGRLVLNEASELVPEPNPEKPESSSLNRARVERSLPKRYPELLAHLPALADGRRVEVAGRHIRFKDPKTAQVVETLKDALPGGSTTPCQATQFRGGIAFLCPSDQAPQLSVWFTSDGKKVSRLVDLYGDVDSVVIAEDGQGLVFRGFEGCLPGTKEGTAEQLCALLPGATEVTPIPYTLPMDADIDGMAGNTVLVYRGNGTGEAAAHVLVNGKSAAHSLVDLREAGREESLTEAHIASDGLVYVLVREVVRTKGEKEPRVGRLLRVLITDAKGAVKILQVPANCMDLAFLNREQALAIGATASDLWWSSDAGKSWQALGLPVDGDASTSFSHPWMASAVAPMSPPESTFGPMLRCPNPKTCYAEMAQNRWLIQVLPAPTGKPNKGEAVAQVQGIPYEDTLVAAKKRKSALAAPALATGKPGDVDARWLALTCEPASADLLANWTYEQANPESPVAIQPKPFGGVEAGLEFTVNLQGDPRFRVYWNYARKKHTYSTSSKQSGPPWEDWLKPNIHRWQDKTPATYSILGGSEGALWLERCTQDGCRQLAVPSDGIPAWLPVWKAADRPLPLAELAFDTDGSGYVHLTAPSDLVAAADVHVLMRIAPDGSLAQRRVVLLAKWDLKEVHLGRLDGTYGLLAASWGSSEPGFQFFALGQENDSSPPLPSARVNTSCPPKSETGTSYWERSEYLLFSMNLADSPVSANPGGLVQWSLVGQSWCVSGLELGATASLPASMVISGTKDHMDNPPTPTRQPVEEPPVDETEDTDSTAPGVGPFQPGEFSGETDSSDDPATIAEPLEPADSDDPEETAEETSQDQPVGLQDRPGVTFKDPAKEPEQAVPVNLALKLYFAAVQGMFTGYLVGGVEPLQLLCTVKTVTVDHK